MNEPIEPIAGGISSVAQLFLSQSNLNGVSQKRTPPQTSNGNSTGELNSISTHLETAINQTATHDTEPSTTEKSITPKTACTGMSIFYDHVSNPLVRLETFANQTAYHNGQIAFSHISKEIITLTSVTSEFDDNGINPIDLQVYDHFSDLEKFGHHLQHVIQSSQAMLLSIEASLRSDLDTMLMESSDLIVFSGSSPDDIIKTYQVLKWLASLYADNQSNFPAVAIYVCDCQDNEEALRLYSRLKETTNKFLNFPLTYHGCNESLDTAITHTELCRISYSDKIISMLQDAIKPKTMQMPTQSDAQGNGTPKVEIPAGLKIQDKVDEKISIDQDAAIYITQFPDTDLGLNQLLRGHLNNWCTSLSQPLHISANLSENITFHHRSLVVVDADGRLHGTIASLDESEALLCEALVLQKWLEDHTSSIQGTFRQLRINATLKPGIIIITANNIDHLSTASKQITELPIKILKLQYNDTERQKSITIS